LIDALLSRIESSQTPEKVAENDHLIKCVMRVIVTARGSLIPIFERTLSRLVRILGVISKNPSNPHFDQYIFESISGLMRFIVAARPVALPTFELALFQPFKIILQQDIDQYVPYVFQILAQMLDLQKKGQVPDEYRSILTLLLTPASWQQKGSIPGLVRLLKTFLARDSAQMFAAGQVGSVLAVVQQRLIPSKLNDAWGFELLQSVFLNVNTADLQQFLKPIFLMLLTRMQANKTDKFVYLFTRFILYTMAINKEGFTPDQTVGAIEEIQPGLWSNILNNFVIPEAPKFPPKDRKLAAIGLTRLICQSTFMLQEPLVRSWSTAYTSLGKLFSERQYFEIKKEETTDEAITAIDFEEQDAGYQAAFSRLAASESAETDPVAYVQNPLLFLQQELEKLTSKHGQQIQMLISVAEGGQIA